MSISILFGYFVNIIILRSDTVGSPRGAAASTPSFPYSLDHFYSSSLICLTLASRTLPDQPDSPVLPHLILVTCVCRVYDSSLFRSRSLGLNFFLSLSLPRSQRIWQRRRCFRTTRCRSLPPGICSYLALSLSLLVLIFVRKINVCSRRWGGVR